MKDIKSRMVQAREAVGLKQHHIGDSFKPIKTRQTIAAWENKNSKTLPSIVDLMQYAKICGCSYVWILNGDGDNFSDTGRKISFAPLISWVQAGEAALPVDNYMPGDYEDLIPCPFEHTGSVYALRVDGDSMLTDNPKSASYPHGSIIFCDPDMRGAVPSGTPVIAYFPDTGKTTFKLHYSDAGKNWLKPLNPAYDIITEPYEVRSVIVFVGRKP